MKKRFTLLITAFMLLMTSPIWGQTKAEVVAYTLDGTITGGSAGYAIESEITQNEITWMVMGNTTMNPWRIGGKSLTDENRPVYSTDPISDDITKIVVTHGTATNVTVNSMTLIVSANSDFSDPTSTILGDFAESSTTTFLRPSATDWTDMYYKIIYNVTITSSSNKFIQFISAEFYKEDGSAPQLTVDTPTFDPATGTYYETQQVSISCATEGATIRYTDDDSEPTESSTLYSTPIEVSTNTTLKAKAFKSGYTESNTATATYTIPALITIAEARALANNEYALVQGVVTFIDGRNVYVQDATGGLDLYLNASASGLALGDQVRAYGKKTVYNGLVELTGINQNSSAFSIISSGNPLPVATKTIAEILEGGADALQCTRVKIESATIGVINTGGNTPLTQNGSSINIYKVPALTGIEEGDEVDVIGVVGYFNSAQIRVAIADDVVLSETPVIPDPTLTVSASELSDFRYTYGNGPSAVKNFTVSGSDLTSAVTLTAPTNYELSLSPDNGYFDSDELSPVSGTLAETTIYVRLKAGLAVGNYTGNITIVSGTLSYTVALSGMVDAMPVAATPTFTPDAGTYLTSVNVTISCETEGAAIHYTLDGSTPTETSPTYSTPITVSTTTTIKAISVVSGYENSSVAEALYTINEPMTIAEARVLANNQYACVEGTVTYITGRNVYIQDATGGIDLYLNSNTVPSALAMGDNVRAYGKKTIYNGLVELTGINGNDANVFTIISSGNTLPLAVQTIADINSDYSSSNLLQATRVKIENAVIGAINPSGNTVITQNGSSLNVYQIPTVEGMVQGDWVTITGIIGCHNAPQLLVASANDVEFSHRPVLTANPTSLSGFTYEFEDGGPSDIQSFVLAGTQLIGDVAIYPTESFEVSTFGGTSFIAENPAMVFIPSSGHFFDIAIYARLKAGLEVGTYNEQIAIVSEGADTLYVNVSGTVTGDTPTPPDPPTPPTPGDGNYIRVNDLSSLTEGAYVVFAARFDENAADYYAMSNASSGKPTGVFFTSATANDNEVLPASIVDEESSYYWIVGVTANGYTFTNADGELIGYTNGTNFATGGDNTEWSIAIETAGDNAMVPGYTGFYITNFNTPARGFSLNNQHNYGAYAVSNNNNSGYNFYLDLFVKTEGVVPPTPTVATPTFTPDGGTYYEEQTVSIACATDGATIYYSTVSENGPWTAYTEAITVDESMTIWAYATKEGYNDSPVAEANYTIQLGVVTIFNQDWEGDMNGWTFVNVAGEAEWNVATYQGNHYAYANGHNQGANIDWCISPAFNLDAYDNPILSFRTAKNFTGNDLEVFFSNNYDGTNPNNAIWTSLTCALSTGGWNWVESGDIDLSSFSGTNCYIGFMYTCNETEAAGWEVDDILLVGQTSEPVLTVTPLTLTGFTYVEGNGPSDEQSFVITGMNLTEPVIIANSAGTLFETSLTSGDDFVHEPNITLYNNFDQTIYVRMAAGLPAGSYSAALVVESELDDISISLSGTVAAPPVPGDDYIRISDVSQLAAGNRVILAARYDETANAYVAMQNTLTSGKLATTEFTSAMNGTDEIIPSEILSTEDDYYWTVGITADGYTFTNASGDVIGYNSSTNFNMNGEKTDWNVTASVSEESAMVPNYYGFNIINVNTDNRAFALNANHVCGAYHTQNMAGADYNFFLDIFMQGEGGTCTVAAPTFNPAGGTYYEPQEVTISCTTEGATIWYSLISWNGPWTPYTEAITVEEFASIWAYASKEGCNDSPVVNADYIIQNDLTIIFWQEWEDDWDPWHGWTERCTMGDSLWRVASYGGNHYAYANGYNHPQTIDWLISPAFDLDSYEDVVLTFNTAKNYNGPDLEVFFSNDYDGENPDDATWISLPCELSEGGWNWVASGDISLDEFSGSNCYIGFRYTSDEDAAGWEVDDIKLASGSTSPTPTLIATPNYLGDFSYVVGHGPSESQSYVLSGVNLFDEGYIHIVSCSWYEISLDNETFTEVLEFPCTDLPATVYVRMMEGLAPNTYDGVYIANMYGYENDYANVAVNVSGIVHYENEPVIDAFMPLYIQGNNGSNNNRVPVATAVYFENLEPNTTYRYTNQFVDENDGPETAGAGNVIYANLEGFYRSTSPSLSTEGGYGEFTSDENGEAFAWFINEPTANARFTPGNHVYLRIRINDGQNGTTVAHTFTTEDYATVLNFGTENDEYSGSAFYAKSVEAAMTFAMLFSSDDDWRPTYSTTIETTGVDYGNINQYADFYKEEVAGNDGWFGGIVPNDNENGINIIWILDMESYVINDYYTENGEWHPEANTVNPTNGLDEPIFIDLTYDGVDEQEVEAKVKVWNADHEFIIENGDNSHYTMTVYSILGQPMMQQQINAGSTERISHSLATGVYIINLQNNQNSVSVKVIVR